MRLSIFAALLLCLFVSCETSNYAPQIRSTSRNASQLERGRQLFVRRCIECHTLPPIWKYSREDWPEIVNDMSHRASLKPAEREAVIAYILAARKQL
jgi:mono/diheme cytochrome c family protein